MNLSIDNKSLSDDVAHLIRKMILNGTLKPGERLNQAQLAEQLKISRGPVREALRLLQNEGLIHHETNKGTYITTLSNVDIYEIYTLRALLEKEAVRLATPNLTERSFLRLEELIAQFHEALMENDLERAARLDIDFHHTIVSAANHQRLIHMHQQLDTQVGAMYFTVATNLPTRASKVVEHHQLLVDVLRSGELELIEKEISNHYLDTLNDLTGLNS